MTAYIRSKSFSCSKHCQGMVILSILIVTTICLLAFFYIIQANGVVGHGYEIRQTKEKLKELQLSNKNLQIEAARLQFPANLEEIAQSLNMVEVGKVVYLKQSSGMAVKAQADK